MKTILRFAVLILLAAGIAGCATKVDRVAVDKTIDLSGRWNDTDSRLVAESMISDVFAHPWADNFIAQNGQKPVVIVGTIRNLSSEHLETGVFAKDIERELVNSGKVKFVANANERTEIRQERLEQQQFSTEETAKRLAAETGADYMLKGSIKTQMDVEGREQVKFYQTDLELIHIESNEKVWIGTKKIKKLVKKPLFKI
ncbi:MAG: penicillin-binding protein activator LpoB [Kiritimatiellales bacterium]|nr:penicillin-binding protein activator LpoB [Kiritimatiellota bacterium]MBL7012465.1 penicillin-binding protein activator LpoB [Kiritimatiellales bacterium]